MPALMALYVALVMSCTVSATARHLSHAPRVLGSNPQVVEGVGGDAGGWHVRALPLELARECLALSRAALMSRFRHRETPQSCCRLRTPERG